MSRQNKQEKIHSAEEADYNKHEREIDLSRFFSAIWNKKWFIASGAVIGAMISIIIALFLPQSYTGNSKLLIKQGQGSSPLSNLVSSGGGLAGALLGNPGGANLENELAILRSRTLAERMADDLITNPIMENGRMYPVLWEEWPSDSVIAGRRSIAGRLMGKIEYALSEKTTIIEITSESHSPYEARDLPNLAMNMYQEASMDQSRDMTGTTVEYLSAEQMQLEDSLANAERALRDYMELNDVVELESQTEQQIQQYAEMTGKRYEAEVQLEAVNASIEEYQDRLNNIKPGLAAKLADAIGSTIQNLQFEISELETERALLYSRNPSLEESESPPSEIQEINRQVAELQERVKKQTEQLLETNDEYLGLLSENNNTVINAITNYSQKLIELRVERLQYEARIEALNEQISDKDRFLENVPENSLRMAQLRRQVEVDEELYLLITKQLAQARFQTKSEMASSRQLDEAILPLSPSFPNYLLFIAGGLFLGGFLMFGYVSVRVLIDDTIEDVRYLRERGYHVIEISNEDDEGYNLFAEHLISGIVNSDYTKVLTLVPAEIETRFLNVFIAKVIHKINFKDYRAIGICNSSRPPESGDMSGNKNIIEIDTITSELQFQQIISRETANSDIILTHGSDDEHIGYLSQARLADGSWIVVKGGSTHLSTIEQIQQNLDTVDGKLNGIVLIDNG